jgi:hypothetical protein
VDNQSAPPSLGYFAATQVLGKGGGDIRRPRNKRLKETTSRRRDSAALREPGTSSKDLKDHKDAAEPKGVDVGPPAPEFRTELDELIRRVSGLEQTIESLKK